MGWLDDVSTAVRSLSCSYFTAVENAAGSGDRAENLPFVGPGIEDARRNIGGAGVAAFCDRPPNNFIPPQTIAGQCETEYYFAWYYRFRNPDGSIRENWPPPQPEEPWNGFYPKVFGPVVGPKRNAGDPGRFDMIGSNGSRFNAIAFVNPDATLIEEELRYRRVDNQPDNCASGPNIPPVGDRTFDIDINGDNATVIIGIGGVNVAGDLITPITINGPNYEYSGTINFNKNEINFNFGGNNPDNTVCCPGDDETESDPPPEDDPPPEEQQQKNVIGVLVTVTEVSNQSTPTIIGQDDNPDIYAPSAGYVNFRVKVGNSFGWTADIPVKNRRHYIPCPTGLTATDVAGTARAGVVWTLTKVFETPGTLPIT